MKRVAILILVISIACSLFANDFQEKVYAFKNGPEDCRNLELQFLEDSILVCDTKKGTYSQYSYSVVGGTILLGEIRSPGSNDFLGTETIPYVLKDGTAVLELDLGYDSLVLYDTGRQQYRSDLAFGIIDKTAVASALITGTVHSYEKYNKFYATDKYVRNHGGEAPSGYRGGRQFMNYEEILPQTDSTGNYLLYREYDVNQWVSGVNRGAERLVMGSDSKSYITMDHYMTFVRIH